MANLAWILISLPFVLALLIGLVVAFADCATKAKEDDRG